MWGFVGAALLAGVLAAGCSRSRPTYEYEPPVTTVRVGTAPPTPVEPSTAGAPAAPTSTPSGASAVPTTVPHRSVWKTRNSP